MTEPRRDDPSWNNWDFWKSARKDKRVNVPLGIISIGYYRKQNRSTGVSIPVAIWVAEDGVKRVQFGYSPAFEIKTAEQEEDFDTNDFQYVSKNPISHAAYTHYIEHGTWPDASGFNVPAPREAKPGDNSGATQAEQEALSAEIFKDQVDSALAGLKGFTTAATKEDADRAQGMRSRLTSLAGEGDKARETEKRPHLEAGRAVDATWNPDIKRAKEGAASAKRLVDDYLAAEAKKAREEAAAKAAAGAVEIEKAAPIRVQGGIGRAATTKEITTTLIVDQDAVYQQFKTNGDVVRLLANLVQKVADNKGPELKGVQYGKRIVST